MPLFNRRVSRAGVSPPVEAADASTPPAWRDMLLKLAGGPDGDPTYFAAFGLDRFDRVRAVVGYGAAAAIVSDLANDLQARRPAWRVRRISDDVFAAALQAPDVHEAARQVAAARTQIERVLTVGELPIDLRLSVGLSAEGPPAALLREAEVALDAARAERCGLKVFHMSSHATAVGALSMMPELRAAIAADGLHLAHQPKVDLRTGGILGVETLVRWTHRRHGPVAPDVFVRMAEETADIYALTRWVLRQALRDQAELAATGHLLPFAVNLSGRLVGDAAFVNWIIAEAPRDGPGLRLEITETAVIDDPRRAIDNITRLASAGIRCSIDDYGGGLSSLAYLKQIDADELKLDKSLIDDVARSRRDALIVRSVVDLAHSLGMKVVAEGIETAETAAIVASMGCELAQGYYFARPMPLAGLIEFLEAARAEAESNPAQEAAAEPRARGARSQSGSAHEANPP